MKKKCADFRDELAEIIERRNESLEENQLKGMGVFGRVRAICRASKRAVGH